MIIDYLVNQCILTYGDFAWIAVEGGFQYLSEDDCTKTIRIGETEIAIWSCRSFAGLTNDGLVKPDFTTTGIIESDHCIKLISIGQSRSFFATESGNDCFIRFFTDCNPSGYDIHPYNSHHSKFGRIQLHFDEFHLIQHKSTNR